MNESAVEGLTELLCSKFPRMDMKRLGEVARLAVEYLATPAVVECDGWTTARIDVHENLRVELDSMGYATKVEFSHSNWETTAYQ